MKIDSLYKSAVKIPPIFDLTRENFVLYNIKLFNFYVNTSSDSFNILVTKTLSILFPSTSTISK